MSITFATCYYNIHSKLPYMTYLQYLNDFIFIVNHFNLVIYTDENTSQYINTGNNPRIKVVIKPIEQFYFYKYKEYWESNHEKNVTLNYRSCWELNMLWSEKLAFVKETIDNKYFDTPLYGWCDAGYFRNRFQDTPTTHLQNWCKNINPGVIDPNRVHYACICKNNFQHHPEAYDLVVKKANNLNEVGLPVEEFKHNMICIGGGFFMLHREKMDWWFHTYDDLLKKYFENNYVVVHDQTILASYILTHPDEFRLYEENNTKYDNWFMFQRILNPSSFDAKISILMPVYNGIEFIEESVSSVLSQTHTNWELIIGVNGHPKGSEVFNIARKYESDHRICVVDLPDVCGKSAALNCMVTMCNGEYVAILDVDDIWHPDKLKKQTRYINLAYLEYDVIGTKCVYFGNCTDVPNIPTGDISSYDFMQSNPIINSSCLIRRELCWWDNIKGLEDYDMWLRFRKQNKKFYNCDEILVKHRIHESSAFNNTNYMAVPKLLERYR